MRDGRTCVRGAGGPSHEAQRNGASLGRRGRSVTVSAHGDAKPADPRPRSHQDEHREPSRRGRLRNLRLDSPVRRRERLREWPVQDLAVDASVEGNTNEADGILDRVRVGIRRT